MFHIWDLPYIVGVTFLTTTVSRKVCRLNDNKQNYCNCALNPFA